MAWFRWQWFRARFVNHELTVNERIVLLQLINGVSR